MLRKIININCLMTFLVVGIHASYRISPIAEYDSIENILPRYVNVLCDMAVPTFFSISAYLFFLRFQMSNYIKKLRGRIKSLLIPYFIFSALGFILINGKLLLKGESLKIHNAMDVLSSLLWADFNPPIWYLLTLFSFVIVTPLLYFLLKGKQAKLFVFVLSIISYMVNICFDIPYSNLIFWLPVIIPFSYLGINRKNIFNETFIKSRTIRSLVLFLTILLPIFFVGANEHSNSYYTYRILSPFFILLLCSDMFDFKPFGWAKYTFMVYLSHSLILVLLEHFQVHNLGCGLIKWCIVFILCLLISGGVRKLLPNLFGVLNGGR